MSRPRTPVDTLGDETTLLDTPQAPPYSPLTPVAEAATVLERAHLSDSEPDDSSSEEGSDSDSDSDGMPSDITFTGKASELPGVLAHCKVTFIAKASKYETDAVKCSYLASLFRGTALDWLGTKLEDSDDILGDWAAFQKTINEHFGISVSTKERIAEQAIRRLRQTGSAQKYANDFDKLAEDLGLSDDTKPNFFRPGLKPDVAKTLVGKDTSTWPRLRTAAIEADEQLYALRRSSRRKGKKVQGGGQSKDSKG